MRFCYPILFSFFFCAVVAPISMRGQSATAFNIDINNGLPANQVYGFIIDRHGYLWITTPKGVVRYNGYEFKSFNLSEGLPYEDIWQLQEDKTGRIWLGNISHEMGYLYNDKYHKATLKDINSTIYPLCMTVFGNGIIFLSPYVTKNQSISLCIEHNNTIYKYSIQDFVEKMQKKYGILNGIIYGITYLTPNGELVTVSNRCLYKIYMAHNNILVKKLLELPSGLYDHLGENHTGTVGDALYSYSQNNKSGKFFLVSLSSGSIREIDLSKWDIKDHINYIYGTMQNDKLFVITDKKIVAFKNTGEYINCSNISDFIQAPDIIGNKIRAVIKDKFWNNLIGTTTNGLWANFNIDNYYTTKSTFDLYNYKFVGGKTDSFCVWWNATTSTIALLEKNKIACHKYDNLIRVDCVSQYNGDTLLVTGKYIYFLIKSTGQLLNADKTGIGGDIYVTKVVSPKDIFLINSVGLCHFKNINNIPSIKVFDSDRYRGLVFDPARNNYWAYNYNRICIYNTEKESIDIISKTELQKAEIQTIEKIAIDEQYGNVFIKSNSSIVQYDYEHKTYKLLFNNFNLKDAHIFIYHGSLIIAGRFGIIFSKILGPQNIAPPVIYTNAKNISYRYIYDYQASWNKILLNTDKGIYEINIPGENELTGSKSGASIYQYKFILNYNDTVINIHSGDTQSVDQKHPTLQFDVINPLGNGALKYAYQLPNDTIWHSLNANELTLPPLAADNYYKLSIIAHDDVWRSDKMDLYLYIRPYWWQTHTGRNIVFLSASILILLLLGVSALVTRKLVLKTAKKKSLQMELELKSIYAQINPHFIFNTLNSALLLVSKNKMDEAYTHISKFSRLLRSYIKSSRNKYITIAEEVENLKNYIELQQVRFKSRFNYRLIINEDVNTAAKIPSLLLQPFVENAINHGILNKQETGNLKIEFSVSEKEIICTIEDDGIGRKNSKLIGEDKKESYGDLLIKDLVNIFNKYEHMHIEIRYTDKSEPMPGTIVTIEIKNPEYAK